MKAKTTRDMEMLGPKDTKSAERVFAILETFERERRALSLKELSEYCQIPMSTCHALVHTLLNRSYLYQTGHRKDFYPTRRLFDIGAVILEHDPVLQRISPTLERLREDTQETVILGKRQKDSVIYLEVLESPQTIRYSANVGDKKPMYSSSLGKAMLGALTPEELRLWLDGQTMHQITERTIVSYARLIENLMEAKKLGYYTTSGENVNDVTAISVPINVNNELYGIAVAGPSHRMEINFDKCVSMLVKAQKMLLTHGIAA